MKKFLITILAIFCLIPSFAKADDLEVTAKVLSKVSPSLSTVTTDLSKLPADGTSSVIITITVRDIDGLLVNDRGVALTSNRGNVDIIYHYEGNTLVKGNTVNSDENGIAKFSVRSKAPGIATFTAVADSVVLNNKPSVTFTPLPFLSNISVTVKIPGGKKITIIQPSVPKAPASEASENSLVNTQVELQISVWYFILLILILLSSPLFFLLLLIVYYRLRMAVLNNNQNSQKEEELLTKIYALEQQVAQNQQTEITKLEKTEEAIKEVKEKC